LRLLNRNHQQTPPIWQSWMFWLETPELTTFARLSTSKGLGPTSSVAYPLAKRPKRA
jgi:hypothetical protein